MSVKHMFEDLEAVNRIDEGRFDLPPLTYRQNIEAGHLAQLATADAAHHWVWVEVVERTPYGYRGIVDVAPTPESGCPVAVGDVVDFNARHVHDIYSRQAVGPDPTYEDLLADAQKLDGSKYWDPVLRIEEAEIAKLMPESMRGVEGAERLAEYLRRHPRCASCEARAQQAEAITAAYIAGAEGGEGDENLMPLCRGSAYVLVAMANGWPVRGCDINGMPNDPTHPWNA